MRTGKFTPTFVLAAGLCLAGMPFAHAADDVSVKGLLEKLTPKSSGKIKTRGLKTRGLKTRSINGGSKNKTAKPSMSPKLRSIVGKIKSRAPAFGAPEVVTKKAVPAKIDKVVVVTTKAERQEIQKVIAAEKLPEVDIEIFFDYNSATIRPQSVPDLTKLGIVLRNPQLAESNFMIIGHTDASGGDQYNLTLSQRRAQSVREFLVKTFGLAAANLIAVGYGEEQLKFAEAPNADENRRVQIVNLTQ